MFTIATKRHDRIPVHGSVTTLVVHALASFRLVKLIRDDRIAQPLRDAVERRWGPPERSKVGYLMNCPWCLSIYFGAALTLLGLRSPRPTAILTRTLAVSALTGLAAEHLDPPDSGLPDPVARPETAIQP